MVAIDPGLSPKRDGAIESREGARAGLQLPGKAVVCF